MSPPLKKVGGAQGVFPGPVPKMEMGERQMDCVEEQQQWEDVALHLGTEQSGLFNMDMDLTSGNSSEHGIGNSRLTLDPSATSTVDLAELFPDLTDLLVDSTPGTDMGGEEEGPSPLASEGGGVTQGEEVWGLVVAPTSKTLAGEGEVLASVVHPACNLAPEEAKTVVVLDAGRREQLPSTSSCASGNEMSDYEDGFSPAEVNSALEHFFNEFIDISNLVNNPAGDPGPTATVDVAAVRSLIDDTTNENGPPLSDLLSVGNDSVACPTVSATKRVNSEENDILEEEEEEEEVPRKFKKSCATTKSPAKSEDTYRMRRIKNNLACKRARQNRKKRDADLVTTAQALEAENALLRAKIKELEEIAAISRKALIEVIGK